MSDVVLRRYEYRHKCGNIVQVRAVDSLPEPCPSCGLSGVSWQLLQAWDKDGRVIDGRVVAGGGGKMPRPLGSSVRAVLDPEGPREHATNALTALQCYREARGSGWHQVLTRPDIHIGELAALLESVEARLRLATAL